MDSEEGKFANPPLTGSFFSYRGKDCYRNPSIKPSSVTSSDASFQTYRKNQTVLSFPAEKSRRLYEFAVATELLNTGETKTTAVISPCVARSCCSCCVWSLDSAITCRILKTTDFPAACNICKAQFPLSLFGLFEDKLSKLKQQSVLLLTKINN